MVRNINNNIRASAEAAVTLPILTKEADLVFFFFFFSEGFPSKISAIWPETVFQSYFSGFFLVFFF